MQGDDFTERCPAARALRGERIGAEPVSTVWDHYQ